MADHSAGDRAVKTWFATTLVWFPLFTTFGFLLAIKFLSPTFLTDDAWITFGRLRPSHVNGVAFGLLSSGLLGTMLYVLPRVVDTPLRFPRLAAWTGVAWNLAVTGGITAILLGYSQGREYAELPWLVDVAILACVLTLGVVVFSTLAARADRKLYVSAWYYAGTMLWFPVVYFIGNVMWRVPTGALSGTQDAIFNWYYGHNILGLWFTTLAIPAWYFFIPKAVKRPLYSHMLSLIAFFSIAFFYTGVGEHHLLQAPIPEWLRTEAVVMSALMIVPVITFAVNILLTTRGAQRPLYRDPTFLFVFTGALAYIVVSFQGSFQAFRTVNQYLHFSQWPVAHAHLALLGSIGFLVFGAAFEIVPQLTGHRIWSRRLKRATWWIIAVGFFVFFSGMTIAGLIQNSSWWAQIQIVPTLPMLPFHFLVRAIGGGMIALAAYLFSFNLLMTFVTRPAPESAQTPAIPAPEPHPVPPGAPTRPESRFQQRSQHRLGVPVIVVGALALFGLVTFTVVGMPYMFGMPKPTERGHELTQAESAGRDLYRANGCFYCHSQFVRSQDWAVGLPSEAGDFFYSTPNFLGTERTGPTLAQIGGKRPTMWLRDHYLNPQQVAPQSIMPHFRFLSDAQIASLDAYVGNLGGHDLATRHFQPLPPPPYDTVEFPFRTLVTAAEASYDASAQAFAGPADVGTAYQQAFEAGKTAFAKRCVSCHGCSGNGQGPYARTLVTRPANIQERILNYPDVGFHFWRISEGVPGTAMPPWRLSTPEDVRWQLLLYEQTFVTGVIRTVEGEVSDEAAIAFAQTAGGPPITGTREESEEGKAIYELYCAQCHGLKGDGNGPASSTVEGGYIAPEPAVFPETGADFEKYGQYVWKVREGVPTTNMPAWKHVLSEDEISLVIFHIQRFAEPADYNTKWGPLYTDPYARTLEQ